MSFAAAAASPTWLIRAAGAVSGRDEQRAARRELQRPVYHRDDPSLVQRILSWLQRRIGDADGVPIPKALLTVLGLAAVVIVGVLLARRAGTVTRTGRVAAPSDALTTDADTDHAALAARLTDQGRYAEALREWLRATVGTLEERGVLEYRPGRTAGEIARVAGERLPEAATALHEASAAFDAVWFAGRPARVTDAEAGRDAAAAVRTARITAAPQPLATYAVPQ